MLWPVLLGYDGLPWVQLIEPGDLRAVREGDHRAGDVTLDGCLGFDAFLGLIGELPTTVGVVRRVRVVHGLHDRGTSEWIRRPGGVRLTDVPDACPTRLRDEPSFDEPMPDDREPEPGSVQIRSPEEYFGWSVTSCRQSSGRLAASSSTWTSPIPPEPTSTAPATSVTKVIERARTARQPRTRTAADPVARFSP
ncbi:hypothetical protein [Actinoplanes aureus]|uniref:Uncharacterized protein n=1 Tax=Actinoplanes aureus TaxID=2792083 RepID=A0A931CEZ8_9ACTN|nr:hypothetical protein [Actinoplanes aureus]MBG0568670.1 hypothetical protein [Actinoplanes aureus]